MTNVSPLFAGVEGPRGGVAGTGSGVFARIPHAAVGGQPVDRPRGSGPAGHRGQGIADRRDPRSTSAYSSWARSGSSSSSQVRGARHGGSRPAAQRVRRDGRLGAVVLAPVDEDLPGPQGAFHGGCDRVGVIGLQGAGELAGHGGGLLGIEAAVQRCVQVDALAAAGHRDRVVTDVGQDLLRPAGDLGALRQAARPRRDRDRGTRRSGLRGWPSASKRHWGTWISRPRADRARSGSRGRRLPGSRCRDHGARS